MTDLTEEEYLQSEQEYNADSIKVLRGLDALENALVCISAIPMTVPACTT